MDPFHERLARVALRAAGQYGFALAGGYAIQAHGFLDRLSADVDLFAPTNVEADFTTAVDAVIQEFGTDGLAVHVEIRNASFARLSVASGSDRSKVEMGVDWRNGRPPASRPGDVGRESRLGPLGKRVFG
jgi:hypothetical protein